MILNFTGISSGTLIGRLLRLPLRLVPDGLVVRIMQGPLKGKRWITGSGSHGMWLGSFEYEKQRAFAAAVSAGDVVFDVGAHVGFYTLLAAELVGPTGQVVAFEPVPRNLELLKRHLRLNGYTNVTVIPAAVSDRPGIAAFAFDTRPERSFEGHIGANGQLQVPTVVLDELAGGGLPIPRVLKMDIEGGEFAALTGARKLLAAHHPRIFLATHGPQVHRQCCDLLTDSGYTLCALDGRTMEETDEMVANPNDAA
jgi:FkbM family methyltransferase